MVYGIEYLKVFLRIFVELEYHYSPLLLFGYDTKTIRTLVAGKMYNSLKLPRVK